MKKIKMKRRYGGKKVKNMKESFVKTMEQRRKMRKSKEWNTTQKTLLAKFGEEK